MIKFKNFSTSKIDDLDSVENGEVFEDCNFTQAVNINILVGKTGLTFRRCNLVNCDPPEDSIIENCLQIKKDFCYHLNPHLPELEIEVDDCIHVLEKTDIVIDGEAVETVYEREDIIIGD